MTKRSRPFRWLGWLLIILGPLALIWSGVTVAWKEPYTAVKQQVKESQLRDQLEHTIVVAAKPDPRVTKGATPTKRTKPVVPVMPRLEEGQAVGVLEGPRINALLTYGVNHINNGPGLWNARPGQGKTVVVSGHRTTYGAPFRHINSLQRGDVLTLSTPWGTWRYRVTREAIVAPTDMWVTNNRGFEQLVLTACHPVYSAAQRYIVFARHIS